MNGACGDERLDDALHFLATFTDYEQKAADQLGRRSLDLGRMHGLCRELGSLEQGPAYFHVAGSKGKGSVTLTIDALLRAQGLKSGRFLSPHLEQVTERIAIDGRDLDAASFARHCDRLRPLVARRTREDPGGLPSFFEAIALMAFLAWSEAEVDAVALEVGLGGRLDATNVVDPRVSIITIIDLEHTRVLGDTLGEIATEKAGIIKPGRPVVSASPRRSEAGAAIAGRAAELGAALAVLGEDFEVIDHGRSPLGRRFDFRFGDLHLRDLEAPVLGRHQIDNLGLVLAALHLAEDRDLRCFDESAIRRGLAGLELPARQQFLGRDRTGLPCDLLLDTAHTPESARSLAATLDESFAGTRKGVLLGMLRDKNAARCAEALAGRFARVFVTEPESPRAMAFAELAAAATVLGPEPVRRAAPSLSGLDFAGLDLLVVTGSVYLAGAIARELRAGRLAGPKTLS